MSVTPKIVEKSEQTSNTSIPSTDRQQQSKPKVSDMVKNYDSMTSLTTIENSILKSKTSRLNANIVPPKKNVISSVTRDSNMHTVADLMTSLNKFGLEVYKTLSNSIGTIQRLKSSQF